VQPTDGKALPNGKVSLTLRCPDCDAFMTGTFSADRVREFDRQLSLGRQALRACYERAVRVNMARELHALTAGFARDLIGPDDFSRGSGAARTRSTSP
jgi:hypothetical protein